MSNLMAAFGEDFVETNILSESNQVRYWIELMATHANAVPNTHVLKINQVNTGGAPGRGINIWQINTSFADATPKTIDLTNGESAANTAFIEYMNSKQSGLFAIMTNQRCLTSPSVTAWFKSKKSIVWPEQHYTELYPNSAYCAIFAAGKGLILYEAFAGNDGIVKEDSRAKLAAVYDNVSTVGLCGIPQRAYENNETFRDTTGYEYKRYPQQDVVISKLADYGLQQNFWVRFTADLFASQALISANCTTRMSVRWFNGTTMLDSFTMEVPAASADKWIRFEKDLRIPSGADGFTAVVSRYPRTSVVAESAVQNVMMVQIVEPAPIQSATQAEFGVNGIRMNKAIEGSLTPAAVMFELPNTKVDSSGDRTAKEFRELQ